MENGHPFFIFQFLIHAQNWIWKMGNGGHFPFFIFQFQWNIKLTVRTRTPYPISYSSSIVTKPLSPAVLEILGPKDNGVTTLTFHGHVTSSVTWPLHSPCPISYSSSIVTKSLSPAVSRYWAPKIIGSRPWPFKVTWRHRSRDHSTPHTPFTIRPPLWPSPYLQPFSRYWAPKIMGSRPWPIKVTWRHRSRDHSTPHTAFPIRPLLCSSPYLQPFSRYWALKIMVSRPWPFKVTRRHRSRDHSTPHTLFPIRPPLWPSPYLQPFSRYWDPKIIFLNAVTPLIFLGHVTSSVMWPIDSAYSICYWLSIDTEALSLSVFEIFDPKVLCAHTLTHSKTHAASDFIFCPMHCIALGRQKLIHCYFTNFINNWQTVTQQRKHWSVLPL